jgi:hypothetical protein
VLSRSEATISRYQGCDASNSRCLGWFWFCVGINRFGGGNIVFGMDAPRRFRDSRIDATDRRMAMVKSHTVDVTNRGQLDLMKKLDQIGTGGSRFQHQGLVGRPGFFGKQSNLQKGTSLLGSSVRNESAERRVKRPEEELTSFEKHIQRVRQLYGIRK